MNDLTGYNGNPQKIRVLFFSVLRDLTKQEEIDFSLPDVDQHSQIQIRELPALLFAQYEGLRAWDEKLLVAVNGEYASRDDVVKSGDEVAIMPPVQGG